MCYYFIANVVSTSVISTSVASAKTSKNARIDGKKCKTFYFII